MSYTVLDLEFNQAYDFEKGKTICPVPECRFEIIQIGAVKLDNNLNIIDNFNMLIKPKIYLKMHPYVEKITGLSMEVLKDKPYFPEAFDKFYKFIHDNTQNNILCVWGNSDIRALYRNIAYYNLLPLPLIIKYIDVQKLATVKLKYGRGNTIGLKNAVEAFGIETSEQFHDAYYDALYTAKIFQTVYSKSTQIKIFNSTHVPNRKPPAK